MKRDGLHRNSLYERRSDRGRPARGSRVALGNRVGAKLFLKPDPTLRMSFGTVSTWAAGQKFEQAAVNTFFQVADYHLVSHALARGYTVVTHEKPAPQALKVIKIPDACLGVSANCMTPFQMLRREKAKFVLGKLA